MRYIKAAGIVWGLVYFVIGAMKSFTLGSNDDWTSVALLFALFLLPLPIAVIAVWFPRTANKALFGCVGVNMIAVAAVVVARHASPLADIGRFIVFIVLYEIPHFFFGVTYLKAGLRYGNPNASDG